MTKRIPRVLLLLPAFFSFVLFIGCTAIVRDGVTDGLRLSYAAVIPSVFPFAVLSSYLISRLSKDRDPVFLRPIAHFLGLPIGGIYCFFIGNLCGFPIGAKCIADGYHSGMFTKKEAERLLMFCNNTGPAFLVGGIGAIRNSPKDGWLLFGIQCMIAVLIALITKEKRIKNEKSFHTDTAPLPLSRTVTDAVTSTFNVVGFVVFFSVILHLMASFLPPQLLLFFSSFVEVSSAAKTALQFPYGICFTAFAVCFSGISVHLQTATILSETPISMRPYLTAKCFAGFSAFMISFFLFCFLT